MVSADDPDWISSQDVEKLLASKIGVFKDADVLFPIFADLAIQGIRGKEAEVALLTQNWKVENSDIVEFVLNADIIYECSPPQKKPLREFLERSASGIAVGVPLGYIEHQATGYPLLLTVVTSIVVVGSATNVTKAVGIILIGAANGVSEGLKNGLAKVIENWLTPPGKARPKKK